MSDPVSVLLIIGGALIGQVQSGPIDTPERVAWRACYERRVTETPSIARHIAVIIEECRAEAGYTDQPYETHEQVCVRVMREVRAERGTISRMLPPPSDPRAGGFSGGVSYTQGMLVGPAEILCIPTPTGFRR